MKHALLALIWLLTTAEVASATTYYIGVTSCSDSYTTTQAQGQSTPWCTFSHANSVVVAGDTVLVLNGTYAQFPNLTHSGTSESPITWKSQNKWGAVIAPRGTGNLVTVSASYVTITGFEIVGDGVATYNTGIKFQTGNTNGTATQNKIHRLGLTGCVGSVGILSGLPNSVIDSNLIYDFGEASCSLDEAIYLGDGDGQVVSNNIVGDANYSGSNLIGIQINGEGATTADFPSNTTVVNNTIFNVSGWGILAPCWNIPAAHTCDHNIFNNNIIYSTGSAGYGSIRVVNNGGTWGTNNTYLNNLIYSSGSANMASGQTLTGTVTSAPLFINYLANGTGDYHEGSGSPSISAGTSAGVPNHDFYSWARAPRSFYVI